VAIGDDEGDALEPTLMVEFCARIHYQAVSIDDSFILDGAFMGELIPDTEEYRKSN